MKFSSILSYVLRMVVAVMMTVEAVASPSLAQTLPVVQAVVTMPVPVLKGVKVFPKDDFRMDFLVGQEHGAPAVDTARALQTVSDQDALKLIKYFMASLATPEGDLWVNLNPRQPDRIVPDSLASTLMGRELLAQDYLLKRLTASLMDPSGEAGQKFWNDIYQKVYEATGATDLPVETLSRVWIVPSRAVVYNQGDAAYVMEAKLKVLLEEEYVQKKNVSLRATEGSEASSEEINPNKIASSSSGLLARTDTKNLLRRIILPVIEKEVNEGASFAALRQIYHSLILAKWFKGNLKQSLLGQQYADQKKMSGITDGQSARIQMIYDEYLSAFKQGAFEYLKEDYDPATQQIVPRKYFSGGVSARMGADVYAETQHQFDAAMLEEKGLSVFAVSFRPVNQSPSDRAMLIALLRALWRQYVGFPGILAVKPADISSDSDPAWSLMAPDFFSRYFQAWPLKEKFDGTNALKYFRRYQGLSPEKTEEIIKDSMLRYDVQDNGLNLALLPEEKEALRKGIGYIKAAGLDEIVLTSYGPGGALDEFWKAFDMIRQVYSDEPVKPKIKFVVYDRLLERLINAENVLQRLKGAYGEGWAEKISYEISYANFRNKDAWKYILNESNLTFWRNTWAGNIQSYRTKDGEALPWGLLSEPEMVSFAGGVLGQIQNGSLLVMERGHRNDLDLAYSVRDGRIKRIYKERIADDRAMLRKGIVGEGVIFSEEKDLRQWLVAKAFFTSRHIEQMMGSGLGSEQIRDFVDTLMSLGFLTGTDVALIISLPNISRKVGYLLPHLKFVRPVWMEGPVNRKVVVCVASDADKQRSAELLLEILHQAGLRRDVSLSWPLDFEQLRQSFEEWTSHKSESWSETAIRHRQFFLGFKKFDRENIRAIAEIYLDPENLKLFRRRNINEQGFERILLKEMKARLIKPEKRPRVIRRLLLSWNPEVRAAAGKYADEAMLDESLNVSPALRLGFQRLGMILPDDPRLNDKFSEYVRSSGVLQSAPHLVRLFDETDDLYHRRLKAELINHPYWRPVFLLAYKNEDRDRLVKYRHFQVMDDYGGEGFLDSLLGFSVGEDTYRHVTYAENLARSYWEKKDRGVSDRELVNQGLKLIVAISDEWPEALTPDSENRLPVHGRRVFFPIFKDGSWLSMKGNGYHRDPKGYGYSPGSHMGLMTADELEHFVDADYPFAPENIGLYQIHRAIDKNKNWVPIHVKRGGRLYNSGFVSVEKVDHPDRLRMINEILRHDPDLDRIALDISMVLQNKGVLSRESVWTGKELLEFLHGALARNAAQEVNYGLSRESLNFQDAGFSGEMSDVVELMPVGVKAWQKDFARHFDDPDSAVDYETFSTYLLMQLWPYLKKRTNLKGFIPSEEEATFRFVHEFVSALSEQKRSALKWFLHEMLMDHRWYLWTSPEALKRTLLYLMLVSFETEGFKFLSAHKGAISRQGTASIEAFMDLLESFLDVWRVPIMGNLPMEIVADSFGSDVLWLFAFELSVNRAMLDGGEWPAALVSCVIAWMIKKVIYESLTKEIMTSKEDEQTVYQKFRWMITTHDPVTEEIVWRYLFFDSFLLSGLGLHCFWAVVISSYIFGLAHYKRKVFEILGLVFLGALDALVYFGAMHYLPGWPVIYSSIFHGIWNYQSLDIDLFRYYRERYLEHQKSDKAMMGQDQESLAYIPDLTLESLRTIEGLKNKRIVSVISDSSIDDITAVLMVSERGGAAFLVFEGDEDWGYELVAKTVGDLGEDYFLARTSRAYKRKEGFLRRGIRLALLARVIKVWISDKDYSSSADSRKMYAFLDIDPELKVSLMETGEWEDQRIVTLLEEHQELIEKFQDNAMLNDARRQDGQTSNVSRDTGGIDFNDVAIESRGSSRAFEMSASGHGVIRFGLEPRIIAVAPTDAASFFNLSFSQ